MSLETNLSGYDICDIVEADGSYNYFGFCKADGSWRILREKTDGTEYRLAVGKSAYSTAFTNRATQTYKRPDQLPRV